MRVNAKRTKDLSVLRKSFSCLYLLPLFLALVLGLSNRASAAPGKGAGPRLGTITHLEITIPNRAALDWLTEGGFDIDAVFGNQVTLFADDDELQALRGKGWAIKEFSQPTTSPSITTAKTLGTYNNYSNMTAMLDGYATNFPAICRKMSIGKTVQNRDIWAMKITTNPDVEGDKPEFRYMATIHGNEPVGTETSLYFIDLLLNGFTTNSPRIVNLVSNVEIWILPLLNPDGRESNPPQRYNASGYDLNRNFPEGSGTNFGNWLYGPTVNTNGVQPETRALMVWSAAHNFVLGANFHTGAVVENYPYDNDGLGSTYSASPDDALFQSIAKAYSSNNPPMWTSSSFVNGIVNGAYWYAITGGLQDWAYRYTGSMETTIELSDEGANGGQWPDPPASSLPTYWEQNRESMLQYLEWSLRGVRGMIRDAQTGLPIKGAMRVEGAHHLVFSDPDIGDYHRLLLPGTYTLWFYAPGYVPTRIPGVTVGSGNATRLDVNLQPVSTRFAAKINFAPSTTALPTGFRADSGAAYGARTGGYTYGWETTLPSANLVERKAARSRDLRYDTECQMQTGGSHTWEIALPNGPYSVLVSAGDANYTTGTYRILVENTLLLDATPNSNARWMEGIGTVVVTDGRLTISNGIGAVSNRLAYVEISALEPTNIDQWRALYFGSTNNTGNGATFADPDGDGIPNGLEYAFGLNPTNADLPAKMIPLIIHTNSTDLLSCSFYRNTNAHDVAFSVDAVNSVGTTPWSSLALYTNGSGWSGSGSVIEAPAAVGRVKTTVIDSQPLSSATNRYLRLRINGP